MSIKVTIEASSMDDAKAKFERFFYGTESRKSSEVVAAPAAVEPERVTSEEKSLPPQEAPLKKPPRKKKEVIPDISEMREAVQNVINKRGIGAAQQIISSFGVHKYSEIHESDRIKLIEACEAAVG